MSGAHSAVFGCGVARLVTVPYTNAVYNWSDIEGQDRAKELLERSIQRQRVHHGQLFVGPAGVGKRSTALAFAKILNCTEHAVGDFEPACGKCPACRKFDNELQHPDLHVIEPQGGVNKTIKIDQVRGIQKIATTRPYEGRWQIVILDDAHAMTDEAANALLKTLEEPPDTMRLILVTDQPQSLLTTIRSRCQTLRFGALDEQLVVRILDRTSEEPPDRARLEVAARYGEGSVGRSSQFLESGLLDERAELLETLEELSRERTANLLEKAEAMGRDRTNLGPRLEVLGVLLRDVLLWQVGIPAERMVNRDVIEQIATLGRLFDADALLARIEMVRVARELITRNVNSTLIVENLYTELAPGLAHSPILLPKL